MAIIFRGIALAQGTPADYEHAQALRAKGGGLVVNQQYTACRPTSERGITKTDLLQPLDLVFGMQSNIRTVSGRRMERDQRDFKGTVGRRTMLSAVRPCQWA